MDHVIGEWLVKVRRYRGGESVMDRFEDRTDAQAWVDEWNEATQSDMAYVDKYDKEKVTGWS